MPTSDVADPDIAPISTPAQQLLNLLTPTPRRLPTDRPLHEEMLVPNSAAADATDLILGSALAPLKSTVVQLPGQPAQPPVRQVGQHYWELGGSEDMCT